MGLRERHDSHRQTADPLADVLTAAVDDARSEIDGVTFTFQTETNRELEREAIADAVATARQKAEAT